jgi:hypothetical protein
MSQHKKAEMSMGLVVALVLAVIIIIIFMFIIRDRILKPATSLGSCAEGEDYCLKTAAECTSKHTGYNYVFTKSCKTKDGEKGKCCEPGLTGV